MKNNNPAQTTSSIISTPITIDSTDSTHLSNHQLSSHDFMQLTNELLNNGNMVRFRANGKSMLPFIKDGDILTITPTKPKQLKNGHIAFYQKADGTPTAHRILGKIKENGITIFLIRGDGYVAGKEKVPAKDIIGIITKVERNGIDINQNKITIKLATAIWSKIQTIRWFFYRIKRKLQTSYTYLANK